MSWEERERGREILLGGCVPGVTELAHPRSRSSLFPPPPSEHAHCWQTFVASRGQPFEPWPHMDEHIGAQCQRLENILWVRFLPPASPAPTSSPSLPGPVSPSGSPAPSWAPAPSLPSGLTSPSAFSPPAPFPPIPTPFVTAPDSALFTSHQPHSLLPLPSPPPSRIRKTEDGLPSLSAVGGEGMGGGGSGGGGRSSAEGRMKHFLQEVKTHRVPHLQLIHRNQRKAAKGLLRKFKKI